MSVINRFNSKIKSLDGKKKLLLNSMTCFSREHIGTGLDWGMIQLNETGVSVRYYRGLNEL